MSSPILTNDIFQLFAESGETFETVAAVPVEGGFKRVPLECAKGTPSETFKSWWDGEREQVATQELLIDKKVAEVVLYEACLTFKMATKEKDDA